MYRRNSYFLLLIFSLTILIGCAPLGEKHSEALSAANTITPSATQTKVVSITTTLSPTTTPSPVLMASPLSGQLVYSVLVSREPFTTQIFTKNLDTGKVKQLSSLGSNTDPIWSPDGSQILFLSWVDKGTTNLYLMDKDGTNQRPVSAGADNQDMADWSPDGKSIAFVSNRDGNFNIYVNYLDTQKINQLTYYPAGEYKPGGFSPKWSPDGKQIAFISNTGVYGRSQVFIMNNDGTNVRQLTKYNVHHFEDMPVWCPSGTCIVFSRFIDGSPKLMLLNLSDLSPTRLLENIEFLEANTLEGDLTRSPRRGLFTFYSGGKFFAMDLEKKLFYPIMLDEVVISLSLYP